MGIIMKDGHQYGVGGIEQADDISYDNTQSGLTATDVQAAVDELSAGVRVFPNYSNVLLEYQSITSGSAVYTATQPCYVYFSVIWIGNKRKYFQVLVNGVRIGDISPRTANDAEAMMATIPLNTGDVITVSEPFVSSDYYGVVTVVGLHTVS